MPPGRVTSLWMVDDVINIEPMCVRGFSAKALAALAFLHLPRPNREMKNQRYSMQLRVPLTESAFGGILLPNGGTRRSTRAL